MSIDTAISDVAQSLGVDSESLKRLITFESSFDPAARNTVTGARGLIQFMPSTAKSLGFPDADSLVNLYPDIEGQLRGPVLSYLSQFKPFPTPQSLYMSVFYPAFRSVSPDTVFPAIVQKSNPGINKVSDYVSRVDAVKNIVFLLKQYSALGFFLPVAAGLVAVFYPKIKGLFHGKTSVET